MVAILLSWYILFLSGFNLNSEVQKPISDRFATLIWSDEFDGSSLNPDKWRYEMGNGCPNLCGWGNGEAQYYTDRSDNIQVENPNVEFIRPCNLCPHMKKITLPKILDCLEKETGEIIMDQETINKARLSVEKMVAIGR